MDVLLVDGYNMIGAWPELQRLKKEDLASAREALIENMAEYQAYTGYKVMVIFDAHMVPGIQATYKDYRVEVIYTKENETADELIERLAIELKGVRTQIHVATSDYAQQWAIFGQGALRKSARELLEEVKKVEKDITGKVSESNEKKRSVKIPLSEEVAKIFENWRRGKDE